MEKLREKYCSDYHLEPAYTQLVVKTVKMVDGHPLVTFVSDHPQLRNHFLCPWFRRNIVENGITFNSCEQYHLYHKALQFGETDLAKKIMNTKYPYDQFTITREHKIAKFDANIWTEKCLQVSYQAHKLKFTQHRDLRDALLSTGDALIVEATLPEFGGLFWGTGFRMSDPRIRDRTLWIGKNKLGEILMRVRDEIRS